jgi:hypothetical protein
VRIRFPDLPSLPLLIVDRCLEDVQDFEQHIVAGRSSRSSAKKASATPKDDDDDDDSESDEAAPAKPKVCPLVHAAL